MGKEKGLNYRLPKELIAQKPIEKRDEARLLILSRNKIFHDKFKNLAKYIEKGSVIVVNNTKVYKAKVYGRKQTGGRVEILLLFNKGKHGEALIKGRNILGREIIIGEGIKAKVLAKKGAKFEIELSEDAGRVIAEHGKTPLPPYIKGDATIERYNTIFADEPCSVAAPTAGLHFTEEVVKNLEKHGITFAFITLHIGIATFLSNGKAAMEPEFFRVSRENAEKINRAMEKDKLVVVGTTAVKAIESAYSEEEGKVKPCSGYSNLLITENYKFRTKIKKMITNFHLPDSPPLKLTCAFAGRERLLNAYREAIKLKYRFYSFGDAMIIERED